jgi:hypothetical protein
MLGVSVREYREQVEGEAWPSADVWGGSRSFGEATSPRENSDDVGGFIWFTIRP